jgi:hypothetical protein
MRSFTIRFALLLPVLAAIAGCSGQIDQIPTTPDPVITTETFTGTLTVNGAQTHFVFLAATGTVTATLTSLGDNPPAKVGFSLGTLAGTTCSSNPTLYNDSAIVNTTLSGSVQTLAGSLCARIYDTGALTQPVDYTFTVSHP